MATKKAMTAINRIPHIKGVMSRKVKVVRILNKNRTRFIEIGVKAIGIFGSVARQTDDENSDVDILVEFDEDRRTFRNYNLLCDLLENRLGKDIDLVTFDGLSPHIGKKILKEVEYVELFHCTCCLVICVTAGSWRFHNRSSQAGAWEPISDFERGSVV